MKKILVAFMSVILVAIVGGCGSEKKTETISEASTTDLYQYRIATEDKVVDGLGFTKNESGMYPSSDDAVIWCTGDMVDSISMMDSSVGKYTFLGISVGDEMNDETKAKIEKCYTLITSEAVESNFRDIYKDNEKGALGISYDMASNEIKSIMYSIQDPDMPVSEEEVPDEVDNAAETENSDTDVILPKSEEYENASIIDTKEFTYWDESQEILVTVEYTSETAGFATMDTTLYNDDGSVYEHSNATYNFQDNGSGWFDMTHETVGNVGFSFEIKEDEDGIPYMNLLDTETYDMLVLLNKEYAYENVG